MGNKNSTNHLLTKEEKEDLTALAMGRGFKKVEFEGNLVFLTNKRGKKIKMPVRAFKVRGIKKRGQKTKTHD